MLTASPPAMKLLRARLTTCLQRRLLFTVSLFQLLAVLAAVQLLAPNPLACCGSASASRHTQVLHGGGGLRIAGSSSSSSSRGSGGGGAHEQRWLRRLRQAADSGPPGVDAATAAAAAGYPTAGVVLVSTAAQLVAAVADPAVQVAVLASSVSLTEADWAPVAQPVVEVRRNLTLLGAYMAPAAWPTVNFGYTTNLDGSGIVKSAKVRVAPGCVLTFRHLVLENAREAPHWLFIGFDVVAASPAPNNTLAASAWPMVVMHEAALWQRTCLPVALRGASSRSFPRPGALPGPQNASGTYVPPGPPECDSSATAPPMTRCWPARGTYFDIAVTAFDQDAFNRQIPAGYIFRTLDVPYWCDHLMTDECVSSKGSFLACFYSFYPYSRSANATFVPNLNASSSSSNSSNSSSANANGAAGTRPSPAPAAGASQSNATSITGGGSSASDSTDVIIGCVIGGVVALVAAAAMALVVRWRRQRQQQPRASKYASGAYGKPSSAGSDGGGGSGPSAVCVVHTGGGLSQPPPVSDSACGTVCSGGGSSKAHTITMMSKGSAGVGSSCSNGDSLVAAAASAPALQWLPVVTKAAAVTSAAAAHLEHHAPRHLQQQEAVVTEATPFRENLNIRASVEVCSHPESITPHFQAHYLSTANSIALGHFGPPQPQPQAQAGSPQLGQPPPWGPPPPAVNSSATEALAALAVRPTSSMVSAGQQGAQQASDGGGASSSRDGNGGESESESVVQLLPVVLGKGAFGRVVAGTYRGQPVAVKQLIDDAWWATGGAAAAGGGGVDARQRDELVRAFVQEVEILGRCDHPNVAKLHAVCLTPPHLSLVLERCETSLDKLIYGGAGGAAAAGAGGGLGDSGIKGSEPPVEPSPPSVLPLSKVLHIAIQVAKGLEYLHPTITHRDLKPANVLLNDADGPNPVAKLSDFGLARMRNATQSTMQPEAGTAAYLAPECFNMEDSAAAAAAVGHRADMYSFGVLLWTMLSGEQPWAEFSLVAIAFKVGLQQHRLPLEPLLQAGRCTPKLAKVIRQCWDADPQRRPAAGEVWKALVLCEQELSRGPA